MLDWYAPNYASMFLLEIVLDWHDCAQVMPQCFLDWIPSAGDLIIARNERRSGMGLPVYIFEPMYIFSESIFH